MNSADKIDIVIRIVVSWVLLTATASIAYIISDTVGVNPWIGAALFSIGWVAGRITRGIERR